jgi:hypothetical protein
VVEGQAEALGRMLIRSRPVGLHHQAIHQAMDLYRVADRRRCFEKVLRLSREFITGDDAQDSGDIR